MHARTKMAFLLALAVGTTVSAQTATMPPHASVFTGFTRGYYFTAPVGFRMTGVQVLLPPGSTNTVQNWAVVRFHNNTPPPPFSQVTNAFDQLAFGLGDPVGSFIPVNIVIQPGDVIGVYGNSAALPTSTSGSNSYTATGVQATTTILSNNVNLFRSGMQFHLGAVTSPQGMHDIWSEPASTAISRVEFTYAPLDPNAVGACCFNDGSCQFITYAQCETANGNFRGENVQCAAANCPQPGACCLNDGTCTFVLQSACATAGGTWTSAGTTCASANCPQPAACCFITGPCQTLVPAACAAAGGAYMGSGSQCATTSCPQPFNEIGDAGDLPATANIAEGTGPLLRINGTITGSGDVDMFQIQICDYQNFSATTVGTTTFDTILSLFNEGGFGVSYNDDAPAGTLQSRLTGQFVPGNGIYYVAVSQYSRHPASTGGRIWQATPFNVERMPDGPGAAGAITGWLELGGAGGAYGINLTGACYVSSTSCYPNCDGSTVEPILNIDDFTCFINEFAVSQTLPHPQQVTSYANCDGSTVAPVLNIDDFTCFINSFAQGCP